MEITEREPGDAAWMRERVRAEKNALRRDRWRAVLLALEGGQARRIAEALGRARRSVQDWVYAYRDGGVGAVQPGPRPGRPTKLPRGREAELRARLDAGPKDADGVCTLRGEDVRRVLEAEFGVAYALSGVYDLLTRLGYACLQPRPRHEKNDPEAVRHFKEQAPFLSGS